MSNHIGIILFSLGLLAAPARAQDAAALRQAESRASELLALDRAILSARVAGEEVRAFRRDDEVAGWISTARGDGYLISFVRIGRDDVPVVRYRAAVSNNGQMIGEMEKVDDLPLEGRELAQFRARQRAEATAHDTCSTTYETLVLPEPNGAWAVYLLPRSAFGDVLLLGGSYRAQVAGDGSMVTEFGPLASGCSVLPNPADAAALRFDDLAGGAINELHVYTAARAGKPLYVNTGGASWVIDGGRIQTAPATP